MVQNDFAVVPGFVVSADVLRQFLDTLKSSEALVADLPDSSLHLDVDNWRQLQQVAISLRQEMMSATLPHLWVSEILKAVRELSADSLIFRSSLTINSRTRKLGNISGLLESQVSSCSEADISLALKSTWSQLFRARSLLYWQRFGFDIRKIRSAVLVQPLRKVIASGELVANSSIFEIKANLGIGNCNQKR
ncbi:MAG: hypothetical protein HC908_07180 [Calothrix sp. SM1_7_51]|nr:hypothetical protein [Calothrix sp. SM1_7_51]